MTKVTAFVGSARRNNTYNAVVQFMNNLQARGDVECEIVRLSDYQLEICLGGQREFGIPAVVGCGNATQHLKTGDNV